MARTCKTGPNNILFYISYLETGYPMIARYSYIFEIVTSFNFIICKWYYYVQVW